MARADDVVAPGGGIGCDDDSTPFNCANVLLDVAHVEALLRKYGCGDARDINMYRKALTHRSYCTRKNENFVEGNLRCPPGCIPLQEESNERLEFLGDAVLNLVVAGYLFERFPDENEGFLTKMRTKLVNGDMLADLCDLTGLAAFMIISRQIEENGGRKNRKLLEDTFEAFLGALHIDLGFDVARSFIVNFIEDNVDLTDLVKQQNNHKDALGKYFQHAYNCLPRYVDMSLPPHTDAAGNKVFTVCVRDRDDTTIATARSHTKKNAENEAARKALMFYGQLKDRL